jgi:DNA-binding MarR family transcriptional regulator
VSLETLAAAIPAPQDLDYGEVLGLWALCYHANDERFVYETNADLARWMHYKEPSAVSRVLTRLENKGYIERHSDAFGRVIYVHPLDR